VAAAEEFYQEMIMYTVVLRYIMFLRAAAATMAAGEKRERELSRFPIRVVVQREEKEDRHETLVKRKVQ
jgi:hypothetical protein